MPMWNEFITRLREIARDITTDPELLFIVTLVIVCFLAAVAIVIKVLLTVFG